MVKHVCFLVLCLLLTACGTPKLNQDFAFSETDEHGLAIFIGNPDGFIPELRFAKINPNTKEIEDTIIACANCLFPTNVYVAGEGEEKTTIVPLPPGHYIVRSYWTEKFSKWLVLKKTFHSYCMGSPIFEIKAGTSHLISLEGFWNSSANENAAKNLIKSNYKISAPFEKVKFKGALKFECR